MSTYAEGISARDAGIAQAADHAASVDISWADRAYEHLTTYAEAHNSFISHDVTDGLVSPTSQKAWGAVFVRAVRAGVIEKVGFGISGRRNMSPTPLWHSRIRSAAKDEPLDGGP